MGQLSMRGGVAPATGGMRGKGRAGREWRGIERPLTIRLHGRTHTSEEENPAMRVFIQYCVS